MNIIEPNIKQYIWASSAESFLGKMKAWMMSNTVLPIPMASSCCTLEFQSFLDHNQMGALGMDELNCMNLNQCDVLVINGTVNFKMLPEIQKVYQAMEKPSWVMAIGSCAISGGPYQDSNIINDITQYFPVDVFVPGCPPTVDSIKKGFFEIQKKIVDGGFNE
jgi:NADH-quinone oxidoreductase subunit B